MTAHQRRTHEPAQRPKILIAEEDIVEFQRLYKKHFGVELTTEEAFDKGLRLIRLTRAIVRLSMDSEDARSRSSHGGESNSSGDSTATDTHV
jgi:hypothetical protein